MPVDKLELVDVLSDDALWLDVVVVVVVVVEAEDEFGVAGGGSQIDELLLTGELEVDVIEVVDEFTVWLLMALTAVTLREALALARPPESLPVGNKGDITGRKLGFEDGVADADVEIGGGPPGAVVVGSCEMKKVEDRNTLVVLRLLFLSRMALAQDVKDWPWKIFSPEVVASQIMSPPN